MSTGRQLSKALGQVAVLCVCLFFSPGSLADVYILPSQSSGVHDVVARQIRQRLSDALPASIKIHVLSHEQQGNLQSATNKEDYIIAIGTNAYTAVSKNPPQGKILVTLIPERTFRILSREHNMPEDSVSAIYIEQPIQRSLDLVKIAFPDQTAGVLVGAKADSLFTSLQQAQRTQGIGLYLKKMKEGENLIVALEQVLKHSNVLIAYADPEVSNRNTAQHLLLTSYRHGIPVVAYSRAYVKAGAIMAVYSTPEQYAQQTAELILSSIASGSKHLPGPQYPKYFSVDINRNVARSLGLRLQSSAAIENRLRAMGVSAND